jgi:hypothetical protein
LRGDLSRNSIKVMSCLLLGLSVLLSGCDSNTSSGSVSEQPAPKNQLEGLQRIREANQKHDQESPKNKRSQPKR